MFIHHGIKAATRPQVSSFSSRTILKWQTLPSLSLEALSVPLFRKQALIPHVPVIIPKSFCLPAIRTWHISTPDPTFNYSYLDPFAETTFVPLELTHSEPPFFQRVSSAPHSLLLPYSRLPRSERREQRFYVAQAPIDALPKLLQADFPTPQVVQEGGSGSVYGTSLWLSMGDSSTPLHRDPNPNLHVQVAGRKTVRLVSEAYGMAIIEATRKNTNTEKTALGRLRGEDMMQLEKEQLEEEIWGGSESKGSTGFEGTLEAGDGQS